MELGFKVCERADYVVPFFVTVRSYACKYWLKMLTGCTQHLGQTMSIPLIKYMPLPSICIGENIETFFAILDQGYWSKVANFIDPRRTFQYYWHGPNYCDCVLTINEDSSMTCFLHKSESLGHKFSNSPTSTKIRHMKLKNGEPIKLLTLQDDILEIPCVHGTISNSVQYSIARSANGCLR
jgi:hypothetical protein